MIVILKYGAKKFGKTGLENFSCLSLNLITLFQNTNSHVRNCNLTKIYYIFFQDSFSWIFDNETGKKNFLDSYRAFNLLFKIYLTKIPFKFLSLMFRNEIYDSLCRGQRKSEL